MVRPRKRRSVRVDAAPGFLRRATISARTQENYKRAHDLVKAFGRDRSRRPSSAAEWDDLLNDYLEFEFLAGGSAAVGGLAIYGAAWVLEFPPRSPETFPKAKRALLGFSTVRPEHVRDPPPEECVWLLARRFLDQNSEVYNLAAAFCLVAFDTYCRASELLTLHRATSFPRAGATRPGRS